MEETKEVEATVVLKSEEIEDLKEIFEVNKKYLSERAINLLGWTSFEVFLGDLIRYGVSVASEDPLTFIRDTIEGKIPLFKKESPVDEDKERKKRFEEEVKKAYT